MGAVGHHRYNCFMGRTFRIIKLIFFVITVLLCLAIPALGLISTAVSWDGICYGFTDGQVPCSSWEYARNEMFWASFIIVPLLLLASGTWLGMTLFQFIKSTKDRTRQKE
jgi:hypothetical protein